ncbi:AcrB/AcrD/AcrF family protein, partial [Lacticaseibacillus rhamnosus]
MRQLESGKAVGLPVSIRLTGQDEQTLRASAERVKAILTETEIADRVRDDWGEESFTVHLKTDPDKANSAGLTNLDVAMASLS